jgi:alanine dehydrogenase
MKAEREILYLSQADVKATGLAIENVIKIVEDVFRAHGEGNYIMPPKVAIHPIIGSFIHAMPAFLPKVGALGIKWVSGYPTNPERGLPTIIGVIIINDPETGMPLTIMDGTWITELRTAAVTAVGAKYLAKKDAEIVGIIGTGVQGRYQLIALNEMISIRKVKVFDKSRERMKKYIDEMKKTLKIDIAAVNGPEDVVRNSDVIITATAGAKETLVNISWLNHGVFGVPIEGEPVWDRRTPFFVDKFVVDNWEQCKHGGQFYSEIEKGILTKERVYAELGEIVVGRKKGRESDNERIVLWARGMATLDVAIAHVVYQMALTKGLGQRVYLF